MKAKKFGLHSRAIYSPTPPEPSTTTLNSRIFVCSFLCVKIGFSLFYATATAFFACSFSSLLLLLF